MSTRILSPASIGEQAVYDALAQPPNSLDRDTTQQNILEKLTPQQVQGSTRDPDPCAGFRMPHRLSSLSDGTEIGRR